jgi:hypothetical protein
MDTSQQPAAWLPVEKESKRCLRQPAESVQCTARPPSEYAMWMLARAVVQGGMCRRPELAVVLTIVSKRHDTCMGGACEQVKCSRSDGELVFLGA